jgi:hypothetical protein
MAEADYPDTEPVDDDSGRDFWNRRVYAFAVVWFLLQLPRLTLGPGLAGTAGSLFGAAIASLAVAGVLKGLYIVAKRGFARLDPRSA